MCIAISAWQLDHPRCEGRDGEGAQGAVGRPFATRAVMPVTALRGAVCFDQPRGWGPGVSKMSYHQRPHELRLAISSEAEALFSDFGGEAYAEACRRAREASSDFPGAGLERRRGDDRSLVGQALIRARRLIRLNRRTLIAATARRRIVDRKRQGRPEGRPFHKFRLNWLSSPFRWRACRSQPCRRWPAPRQAWSWQRPRP